MVYVEDLDQNLFFLDTVFAFRFSRLICILPGITVTGSRGVSCADGKFSSHTEKVENLVFFHELSNPSGEWYQQGIIVVVYLLISFLFLLKKKVFCIE